MWFCFPRTGALITKKTTITTLLGYFVLLVCPVFLILNFYTQAARETGALQAAKNKLEKQVEELTWRLQLEKRMRVCYIFKNSLLFSTFENSSINLLWFFHEGDSHPIIPQLILFFLSYSWSLHIHSMYVDWPRRGKNTREHKIANSFARAPVTVQRN